MSAPERSADPRPTISAMLRASAARWPELPCWVEDGREVSYAAFDAQVFATIVWTTPGEATDRGALVFRISCSKCHGEVGAGDGLMDGGAGA